jgi:hypothetical protein
MKRQTYPEQVEKISYLPSVSVMMSMKGGSTRWKTMKEAPSNNIVLSEIIKGRGGWIRRAGRKEEQLDYIL